MTKLVNPLGRDLSLLDTKAEGCNCTCHQETADTSIGKAGAWIPIIPGCGCICESGNDANKSANSNRYHNDQ